MALQKADIQRFEWFKAQVERLGIRFPVAEIAEKTGFDQGNVSSYLKGKKPLSDNFLTSFRKAYNLGDGASDEAQPSVMQILSVLAEAFKAQAEIMKSIESKMAQEKTQARMEINLNKVFGALEAIGDRQDDATKKILSDLAQIKGKKNGPSEG